MTNISLPAGNGLLAQLTEMGGPVMVVLLAIALLGIVAFVYLMLLGILYAPRLPAKLKKTVISWQQNSDAISPETIRKEAGNWGRLNPLLHLVTDTMDALKNRQDDRQIRETAAQATVPLQNAGERSEVDNYLSRLSRHLARFYEYPHRARRLGQEGTSVIVFEFRRDGVFAMSFPFAFACADRSQGHCARLQHDWLTTH